MRRIATQETPAVSDVPMVVLGAMLRREIRQQEVIIQRIPESWKATEQVQIEENEWKALSDKFCPGEYR